MDLIALRFGKLLGVPVNLLHVCGFALHPLLGGLVLGQHKESRKADYHSESDVKSAVDQADGDGVRFAQLYRYSIVCQNRSPTARSMASEMSSKPKSAVGSCADKPGPLLSSYRVLRQDVA